MNAERKPGPMRIAVLGWIVALACTGALQAGDWPGWRGPGRSATWTELGIVQTLPSTGLKVLWRAPVAMGFSSPVVVGDRVYLSDAELSQPVIRDRVHCLRADSGRRLWTHAEDTTGPEWLFTEDQARGPGSTPLVHQGRVYAANLFGKFVCLDASNGHVIWKKDLKTDFQMQGTSVDTSPLIEGDLLILMLGGKEGAGVVALDPKTGREVWRSLSEGITWSSPIAIASGGVRQLIVWTQRSVSSLDPATGSVYWREATSTGGAPGTAGVATPVYQSPYLLVSGWMFSLEQDRPAVRALWPEGQGVSRRILSDTSTGVVWRDHVYSAVTGGAFVCLKAATGEEVWRTSSVTDLKGGASVHLTRHGDSAFLLNDRGELIQIHLTPAGYEEIARTRLIDATWPFGGRKVVWAAPAFARQNIYVRNDRELLCVSMAAKTYRGGKHAR